MYLDCLVQLSLFEMHGGDVVEDLSARLWHRHPLGDGLLQVAGDGSLDAIVPADDGLLQRHGAEKLSCFAVNIL